MVGAAVVLAASVAWLLTLSPAAIALPASGRAPGSLDDEGVALPPIGPFENFNVNDANPFVSWTIRDGPVALPPGTTGPTPGPGPGPSGPQPIPRKLPVATPGGGDAPRVNGFVRGTAGASGLMITLPGETSLRLIRPGERVGRWTFTAIADGNVALFSDENGRAYRLVIGAK